MPEGFTEIEDDDFVQMEQAKQQGMAQQQQIQQAAAVAEVKDKEAGAAQKQSAAELNQAKVIEIGARLAQPQQPANDEDALINDAMAEARQPPQRQGLYGNVAA